MCINRLGHGLTLAVILVLAVATGSCGDSAEDDLETATALARLDGSVEQRRPRRSCRPFHGRRNSGLHR